MLDTFEKLKMQFEQEPNPTLKTRLARLRSLRLMIDEYTLAFCEAIREDFGHRSHHETKLAEIFPLLNQIKYLESHLPLWLHEEKRSTDLLFPGSEGKVLHVPLGVVGIMTPWNFPLLLALSPLMTALAGGNLAMVKMSELTPKTALILKSAVQKHLGGCAVVFAGDLESNKQFANIAFDHLFFTGSPRVGSLIMQAAALNLTPVTLELGGKTPVIAAPDFNLEKLAEKIIWAKTLNAGQICIGPDYLVCPEDRADLLIEKIKENYQKFFPLGSVDDNYTSIITQAHFDRLMTYLDEARDLGVKIIPLASEAVDIPNRRLAPHILINPPPHLRIAREEIFGPLLPIYTYGDFKEAKPLLQRNPHPLALYLFTSDPKLIQDFERTVSAGGICINDLLVHISQDHLPFGGVRTSGMGQYHGVEGFLTFTRPKAIFKAGRFSLVKAATPPYKSKILKLFYAFLGIK